MFNAPHGWQVRCFSDFLTEVTSKNKESHPYEPLSVTQGNGVILQSQKYKRRIASEDTKNYKLAPMGSFVMNPNYLNFGAIGIQDKIEMGVVSSIYGVFVNDKTIDTDYLSYLLRSRKMINEYNRFANGGCAVVNTGELHGMHVRLTVPIQEFLTIKWPFPSLREQQKIAAILSSADQSIEKTEQIIKQTEKVKKGLMQQLLTKGVAHKKFKKTPIGELPEEWEVKSLEDVVRKIVGGGTPSRKIQEFYRGNIPWVTVKDLKGKYIDSAIESITKEGVKNSSANLIPANNVVVATRMAIGKAFKNTVDVAINQDLKALFPNENVIIPDFLLWVYLNQSENIERLGTGTTVKGIRLETLKEIQLGVPTIDEQIKITNILQTYEKKINGESKKLSGLKHVKKGLMQQLLTGKVRVPIDDEEVVET
ncbi:restriction endonuclease subunit S [Virgibacillus salinus]|uniref:Type I restriction enzyme, S subunit n=1 Tax=Virgibacillus salinus TaxID=553311 RepID=A0A1H1DYH8_9BACI|nr:restriction endonuclease subunit S [Virgibacillus salinus]SDQ81497.1 type I restriction enzyme, S subunit [Virgibacillus salinus]